MLTSDQLNRIFCAVLLTLDDDTLDFAPETSLYLGTGLTLDQWYTVKRVLWANGLITEKYHAVSITPKGHAMALRINAHARECTRLDELKSQPHKMTFREVESLNL